AYGCQHHNVHQSWRCSRHGRHRRAGRAGFAADTFSLFRRLGAADLPKFRSTIIACSPTSRRLKTDPGAPRHIFCGSALARLLSRLEKTRAPNGPHRRRFSRAREMYARARPMAADYPLFGTGPGSFVTVFQLYRRSYETYWPAQLHNDWLETRITF